MNDMTMFATVVGCAVAGLIAFGVFHTYMGLRDSLSNARVGSVYNFEYVQPVTGTPERFMAKVLEVHRFSDDYISRLNATSRYRRYDDKFQRSRHLVTAQTPDGKIRNFYAERTRNVRRPLLGGVAFKTGLASLLF
jgi:uncharacterized membrane protein YccC